MRDLYDRFITRAEVVACLEESADLDAETKTAALRFARLQEDNPGLLCLAAAALGNRRNATVEESGRAIRLIEAARRLDPKCIPENESILGRTLERIRAFEQTRQAPVQDQ